MDLLCRVPRVPPPDQENSAGAAARLGDTVVLPVVQYASTGRYEVYRYVTEQPDEVAAFFAEHL